MGGRRDGWMGGWGAEELVDGGRCVRYGRIGGRISEDKGGV
jgi:hypothetical protein